MKREVWIPLASGIFLLGAIIPNEVCREVLQKYGIALPHCPDGTIRQTAELSVQNARRGVPGTVYFNATAHYTVRDADDVQQAPIKKVDSLALTLVDGKGKSTPIAMEWSRVGERQTGQLTLPDVPDGDYKLHAEYETKLGPGTLDVPLPLFTPARVHVITDRPLYEPGNLVKFRAVVLRARDLGPLDGRPGIWQVKDPSGEVLLEEKAAAGEWGVVSGTFPIDKGAPTGQWHVAWVSNDAIDEIPFTVEPFTLPRFRVEATSDKPYYGVGDAPAIKGAVLYSSGAPVANAKLDIQWNISGAWPAPLDWQAKLLPKTAVTSATGRFELALPRIPDDLQGKVTMSARIGAVDPAGDRVDSTTTVLLSKDGIEASAVTELGNGLVENFNNRLFVRVATPDGRVVSKAKIRIKKTWQENDNGEVTDLDEDGVAQLQIDPGAPVNIVIPALPYRPEPRAALVARGGVEELIGDEGASLADQVEMDRWLPALAPCAKFADDAGDATATVGLRVGTGGNVITAAANASPLDQCVVNVVRGKRLPGGAERLFQVTFNFTEPDLPSLTSAIEAAVGEIPEELRTQLSAIELGARDCLPRLDGELPDLLTWRIRKGAKEIELGGWSRDPKVETNALRPAMGCVTQRMGAAGRIKLTEDADADQVGIVRFTLSVPSADGDGVAPQATTMIGYELDIVAEGIEGKPSTKLRIQPGAVPNLRMRVTPVIAKPGDTITAQLIRGPEFTGELPKELEIQCLKWKKDKLALDEERKIAVAIDPSVEGWCEVKGGGVRALVYVRPQAELAVTIAPKQPTYRPGQRAELVLRTLIGGRGGKAAVGLFGVDESLGQLAPLPGADSMGRVQPQVETSSPAFGTLDGQALALGRIRGANASAATVLRVSTIPKPPELDAVVNARASSKFDPVEELSDHFYIVLAELHQQARQWEAKAAPSEKMRPPAMAELWQKALDACKSRGEPTTDAYGRRLELWRLPADLLSLTDPRSVIVVATRLPEDVENWAQWVAREKP